MRSGTQHRMQATTDQRSLQQMHDLLLSDHLASACCSAIEWYRFKLADIISGACLFVLFVQAIPDDLAVSRLNDSISQHLHLLAEHIVDLQLHTTSLRYRKTNCRAAAERIRKVLLQFKRRGVSRIWVLIDMQRDPAHWIPE